MANPCISGLGGRLLSGGTTQYQPLHASVGFAMVDIARYTLRLRHCSSGCAFIFVAKYKHFSERVWSCFEVSENMARAPMS